MNPPAPAIPASASPPAAPAPASGGLTRRRTLLLAAEAAGIAAVLVFAWRRPTAADEAWSRYRAFAEVVRTHFSFAGTKNEYFRSIATMPRAWNTLVAQPRINSLGPTRLRPLGVKPPPWSIRRLFPWFPLRPVPQRGNITPVIWVDIHYADDGTVLNVGVRENNF